MKPPILVVDDDLDTLEMLQDSLSCVGYQVEAARSGSEALAKARSSSPSAVILDVILPDTTGFKLCETLRREPATSSLPILLITGAPGDLPMMAGLEAGADAFLYKPFKMEELLRQVNSLLKTVPSPSI